MSDDATETHDDEVPEEATVDETATSDEQPTSEAKAKADAVIAERNARTVTRRTVTSRRVTPKGGAAPAKASTPAKDAPAESSSKARDAKKTESVRQRTTAAPTASPQVWDKGPSPWWVPAIMFALLIVGALVIMLNYMGAFGDASNVRLVIGLGLILGGIITATQYR